MNKRSIAEELKLWLMRNRRFEKGDLFVADEITFGGGIADVFSVTKALYVNEFEVKMSYADFQGDAEKTSKWETMRINREAKEEFPDQDIGIGYKLIRKIASPNYFHYVLFGDAEKAIPEIDPDFGIILAKGHQLEDYPYFGFETLRRSKKLHEVKIKEKELFSLLSRYSARMLMMRLDGKIGVPV